LPGGTIDRYPVALMRALCIALVALAAGAAVSAQQAAFDRVDPGALDARPPSARVAGEPGRMTIQHRDCRPFPAADVRRRIVELAVQEWGFFGFAVVDRTDDGEPEPEGPGWRRGWGRSPAENARVAASIGGYWAVTPDGAWILDSQNAIWNRPDNESARWRYAWSAAFVSWVMCESGLAGMDQFQRDVAHHRYIDQAIRARDGRARRAAFDAHQPGEAEIAAGDLLCTARRPAYRTLAERRRQMGVGARTHCDIVVKVDEANGRVLAIGGNVRGTVGLKALPAARAGRILRVVDPPSSDRRGRPIFAHLKLGAAYPAADAFDASPAVRALACAGSANTSAWRTAAALVASTCAEGVSLGRPPR
jgi:hypothetical protein